MKKIPAKKKTTKYQVDQSGKIEDTAKLTVVALSNGLQKSIILSAKDKRDLQKTFREAGKPKVFSLQVFAALVYILLEKSQVKDNVITLDKEYPGHENLIKSYIVQLINKRKKVRLHEGNIRFGLIGKLSPAHNLAYISFKKKRADLKATYNDIIAMVLIYEK